MAGLLHDLYAYKSGSYDDHAHLGAEYARKLLEKLAITTPEETDVICAAIWHHDSKAEVDGPMDEILKDADVIDRHRDRRYYLDDEGGQSPRGCAVREAVRGAGTGGLIGGPGSAGAICVNY